MESEWQLLPVSALWQSCDQGADVCTSCHSLVMHRKEAIYGFMLSTFMLSIDFYKCKEKGSMGHVQLALNNALLFGCTR